MSTFNAISGEVKEEREIFFSKNPNPMWIYDQESLKIIEANEVAASMYGYSQEEMSSLTLKDLRPVSEVSKMLSFMQEKEQAFADIGIWKHQKSNGDPLYIHLFTYPLELEDKTYVLTVARDVTQQSYIERELHSEQEFILEMIDNFPGIFCLLDQEKKLTRWNKKVEALTGYSHDELKGSPLDKFLTPVQKRAFFRTFDKAMAEGQAEIECNLKTENSISVPFQLFLNKMTIHDTPHFMGLGIDINSLKTIRENLEIRSRAIENAMDAVAFIDHEGMITDVNKAKLQLCGYNSKEEILGKHWSILYTPSGVERIRQEALPNLEHENQWKGKMKGKRRNGSTFDMELSILSLADKGFVAISKNITEQKKHERQIKKSLEEKEVMLTEIHHRVKNNLAVVSSMLQLQAFEEENDEVKTKLLDSVLRIKSMATIHEQLYQAQSFSEIDFSEHIKKLANNILDAHQSDTPVELIFRLEPLTLNVNQAVPCSLIINEVITNSLKHAFRNNERGTITFEMSVKANQVKLVIKDNGKGLPEDFSTEKSHTLGRALINVLVQQLEANHQYISTSKGTSFTLAFGKSLNNNN